MGTAGYLGAERRSHERMAFSAPLAFKVCKQETITKILEGYTSDVSESGLLCTIREKVHKDDILWLSFDRGTLEMCSEMERRSLIYQNGIVGKVVRIIHRDDGLFDIGVQFLVREEKNHSHIYPKVRFLYEQDGPHL